MSNEMSDDELGELRASPWAVQEGLLVEVNGEVFVTQKGLERLAELLGSDLPAAGSAAPGGDS